MYISKDINWLKSFIDEVKPMFPKIKQVKSIKIMKTSYSKRDRAYGQIAELDKGYKISIRTSFQHIDFYPLCITLKPFSKIDMLITLAHELSHLYHWTHSPEHKLLENHIANVFMFKLKSDEYKDEENELGGVY